MADQNVMIKLFDTLKDAIRDMNSTLKEMLTNQKTISAYMETLPIDELKDSLKEHNKESSENIDECTDVVNTHMKDIMKKLDTIYSIVYKTTVVVGVFIAIISAISTYNKFIKPDIHFTELHKTVMELQETIDRQTEVFNIKSIETEKKLENK